MKDIKDIEDLGLCSDAAELIYEVQIFDADNLVSFYKTYGVHGIIDKLSAICRHHHLRDFRRRNCDLITIEILIKLALSGFDVHDEIKTYISELIEADVKYSTVQFWRSLLLVLKYLPDKKYTKLKPESLERYSNSYKYAAKQILEKVGVTPGEILPEEDYIEIICPVCSCNTSIFFGDFFRISCEVCAAKRIANSRGFYLYSADECEDRDISFEKHSDEPEDVDFVFVCKLCNSVCETVNLNLTDYSEMRQIAENQECLLCMGEIFLAWLANETHNTVDIAGDHVKFTDEVSGETTEFTKEQVNPQALWKKIIYK